VLPERLFDGRAARVRGGGGEHSQPENALGILRAQRHISLNWRLMLMPDGAITRSFTS
jgi:hypothetical protein